MHQGQTLLTYCAAFLADDQDRAYRTSAIDRRVGFRPAEHTAALRAVLDELADRMGVVPAEAVLERLPGLSPATAAVLRRAGTGKPPLTRRKEWFHAVAGAVREAVAAWAREPGEALDVIEGARRRLPPP